MSLDGELWNQIERRWATRHVDTQDGTTKLSAFVFHRAGEPRHQRDNAMAQRRLSVNE